MEDAFWKGPDEQEPQQQQTSGALDAVAREGPLELKGAPRELELRRDDPLQMVYRLEEKLHLPDGEAVLLAPRACRRAEEATPRLTKARPCLLNSAGFARRVGFTSARRSTRRLRRRLTRRRLGEREGGALRGDGPTRGALGLAELGELGEQRNHRERL